MFNYVSFHIITHSVIFDLCFFVCMEDLGCSQHPVKSSCRLHPRKYSEKNGEVLNTHLSRGVHKSMICMDFTCSNKMCESGCFDFYIIHPEQNTN